MPNVIDIPLTDLENLEISPNKAYVKFRKNQSEIEVSSEVGKGIIIESSSDQKDIDVLQAYRF